MIAFAVYLALALWLIYRNGFFGIFRDERLTKKQFTLFFFLKALAVPAFYLVYKKLYGGVELFDAGKFYHDAAVISDHALKDPGAYLRLMLGLQNDAEGSGDFVNFLSHTDNWDNGKLKDYLYNDNRVVIRVHSLLHFIAFGSYFVHALFSCLMSYIGIAFLYRSFKAFFAGRELALLSILCFFPALWFYTGGLLKEGITLLLLGLLTHTVKLAIDKPFKASRIFGLLLLLCLALFLKPYILLFCSLSFGLFFYFHNTGSRFKTALYFGSLLLVALLANLVSIAVKGKSLPTAALEHQRLFADASKGGIFLVDNARFIRLRDDSSLVKKVRGSDSTYSIAHKAPFVYWELSHQQDTLYCPANADTASLYKLVYHIPESRSNLDPALYNKGIAVALGTSLYYSLFHPFFVNAKGPMKLLASTENLLILLSLLVVIFGLIRNRQSAFLPLALLVTALCVCVLTGIATPNSGAIFRYRSPVVIFILMAALYYIKGNLKKETISAQISPK